MLLINISKHNPKNRKFRKSNNTIYKPRYKINANLNKNYINLIL